MTKSALELLDTADVPIKESIQAPQGGEVKSALSLLESEAPVTKTAPVEPQSTVNVNAYDPIALFSKLGPKVPEVPSAKEPPKLSQGGRLGEIKEEKRANDLAFDVLKSQYPIASTSYLLQATNNMGGVIKSPDLSDAIKAGFRQSVMGKRGVALGYKDEFNLTSEQYSSLSGPAKFAYSLAAFGGDIPSFVFGGLVGSTVGGPVGAMGGAFAMAEGLRSYYDQMIEKGEIRNATDLLKVINNVGIAEVKGMVTGKLTEAAGVVGGKVAGGLGRLMAEAGTLTAVPPIMESRLPSVEDYYNTASFLLGMNMIVRGPSTIGKMRKLFVKTGMTPKEVIEEVKVNPELGKALTDESVEIPEEVLAKAKAKVDAAVKIQADLAEAEKIAKNPPTAEEIVKEELKTKGKKVKEAKGYKVEDLIKEGKVRVLKEGDKAETVDESVSSLNGLNETASIKSTTELIEPSKPKVVKRKATQPLTAEQWQAEADKVEGVKFNGMQERGKKPPIPLFTLDRPDIEKTTFAVNAGETLQQAVERKYEQAKKAKAEPITDIDLQTGTPLPKELSPSQHPFRDKSPDHTNEMSRIYRERIKNADVDPEVFTRYLINEMNRYLNGEEPATPIEKVRNALSQAAVNADNAKSKFDTVKDFKEWKDTVTEAARWARESERPKEGTQLNMMIPVNELPKVVKDLLKNIKAVWSQGLGEEGVGMYRNKEIFDKTGFWFGKDGKWRYEVGEDEVRYDPNGFGWSMDPRQSVSDLEQLSAVSNVYALSKKVSGIETVRIKVDPELKGKEGEYDPEGRIITLKSANDKDTFHHELQHAVNDIMKSKFRGSNVEAERARIDAEFYTKIRNLVKSPSLKAYIDDIQKDNKRLPSFSSLAENIKQQGDTEAANKILALVDEYQAASAFENYMKDPGEMEARLASYRRSLTPEQRKNIPPWETLDYMLQQEGFVDGKTTATQEVIGTRYTTVPDAGLKLYSGLDPTEATRQIIKLFKGFHGTSSKYIKPEEIVGKELKPRSLKQIVEDTLDELELSGEERNNARQKILDYDYFNMAVRGEEFSRPFDKVGEVYAAKDFESAAEYAEWAGEAYDNALIALGAFDKNPTGIAKKAKEVYDDNRKATPYVLEVNFDRPLKEGDNISNVPLKVTKVYDTKGTRLYSGIDPTEATRQIIKGAKDFMTYMERARGMKSFKPGEAIDKVRQELVRDFVDRSGNLRKDLLDTLGDRGYQVVQKAVLTKGASSLAAQNLKQMQKEVYDGLSSKEKRILDGLILSDRMADIGGYKNNFKFPEGISTDGKVPDKTIKYRTLFQQLEGLTDEQASLLDTRAKAYFEWMKKPLKDLLDAELISQAEYDLLASHNYRRLKLVDIFDKRYQTKLGKKIRTVYDSGVEALAHGRETDVFEPSSEVMALEVFNRAYGRIFNNAANKNLLDLAREQKDNPFVATKDSPKDRIPSGWDRVFVYEKGERKAIYISPEVSREWITNNPEMSYKFSQFLRYASGSAVLRTFATGIDWGFAMANLPRDIMHIWYASRVFENGEWKPLYSSTMPIYFSQMAGDIGTVFSDALLRGKKYQDYIKEGGGMEFLVHQGRLLQRGRHVEGGMDKVMNFLGYLGETSEIMTRLAVRDRVIKRRASEQGLTYEEASKDKKITQEATFAARDYMDFGQGGSIAKGLDNAFPYLNASIQGTRGLFRAFKDNPWESTYKLAQFTALVSGLYIAAQSTNPETMKALKGSLDPQGNLIIPLGDGFGFDDEKGQRHYPYLKIPLDPGQKFFKTFIEGATDKMMGNEVDVKGITNSLAQISPATVSSLPPTVGSVLGYFYNKDFWNNDDIWKKTDKSLNWPQSKEEFIPGQTPNAMVDIGQLTGLSPERLKYALSELVTGGSVWGWLVGQGYDAAFHSLPAEKKEQHLAMVLSKTPMIRRFFGVTNPYNQFSQTIEDAQSESMVKRWVENRGLDQVAQGYLFDNVGSRNDVVDYIRQFKDSDTRDRLKERFIFQEKTRDLPNRSFWLSLQSITDTDARAKVYVERLEKSNAKEFGELIEEKRIVQKAGGVFSDNFNRAVSRIRAGVE